MYTYDVFISYCSTDQPWVSEWLYPRLRKANITVCVDKRDFEIGATEIENIENAIAHSRHILLVLTPSWLENHWKRFDFHLGKLGDPSGALRRTLPVIRKPCDGKLPASITMLTCADFTVEANNEEVFHTLLKSINGTHRQDGADVKTVEIPFVIAAMTQAEARSLFEKEHSIFNHPDVAPSERERFQQVLEELQEWGIETPVSLYGKGEQCREDWKPFNERTIHDIVEDIVGGLTATHDETSRPPRIRPRFFSTEFFAETEHTRVATWEKLGHSGCILIIDNISLFHPTLRERLKDSEISSNNRVAVLGVSPIGYNAIRVNILIEEAIKKELKRAYSQFNKHLNNMYEFGIGDLRALQRWLIAIMPEATARIQNQRPNSTSKELLEQSIHVHGMSPFIFGEKDKR